MNIKDFKESLKYLMKAEITPFIWGHAGIGKTSVVKQVAKEEGFRFFALYLGTQSDLGDILGLADFVRDEAGNAVATTFATPKWLKDIIDYCNENPDSGAIIFLDEFNRARKDILSGMFPFALDKTFHTIKLPKNCHLIAAGNPPTDEYGVADINETALMGRFAHIKLEPSFEEWVEYAKSTGVEPSLIEFYKQQPNLLNDARSDFNPPVKKDPRAAERFSKLFQVGTPMRLLEQLAAGVVGLEVVVAYQRFLRDSDKPLAADEVFKGVKLGLIEKWSNPENVAASFLNLTCTNLKEAFRELDKTGTKLETSQKKNFVDFLVKIPKDIAFTLMRGLADDRNKTFIELGQEPAYEDLLVDISRVYIQEKKHENK